MTQHELARALGVTTQTIRNWREQGCPHEAGRKGSGGTFDLPAVFAWRIRKAEESGLSQEGLSDIERKVKADADMAELRLAERRRELVRLDDADRLWIQTMGGLRAKLRAIPSKAAPRVIHAKDEYEALRILSEVMDAALTEIADTATDLVEQASEQTI